MDFSKINLKDNQELARYIVKGAISKGISKRSDFERFRNQMVKLKKGVIFHNLYFISAYKDLVEEGEIEASPHFLSLIQKRSVRTMSGVVPLTVMTKPFPCPGRCVYCPTDVRMPKSYLPSQPAAQRAFRQQFNPYTQVFVRLKALLMTGHEVSKVELRIIGGTWSSYKKQYQRWFVKMCLIALNEFYEQMESGIADNMEDLVEKNEVTSSYGVESINTVMLKPLKSSRTSFEAVVKENETARVRCIGINVETRPDHIDKAEVRRLRSLGVTKIEMGVQTTDDEVQRLTKRGHSVEEAVRATKLLKDAGFKISYHMMPNLPGAKVADDKKMIGELFKDDRFQPDYLKIYPCVVMPKTELFYTYKKGLYKSYSDKVLEDVLFENLKDVPEWCRVDRVARDIPSNEIASGFKVSNVRQVLEKRFVDSGSRLREIRFREVKNDEVSANDVNLIVRKYDASGGVEFFISFEDVKNDKIIALLRLRFPGKSFLQELSGAALIREVHVYGKQIAIGKKEKSSEQHVGWGGKLMLEAEKVARDQGFLKIAVISGIGTREYYRKSGYKLVGTYMVKSLFN